MSGHPYFAAALVAMAVNVMLQPLAAMMWRPGPKQRPTAGGVVLGTFFGGVFAALYAWAGAEVAR